MKHIKAGLTFLSVWLIFYVMGIIITLDFNITHWSYICRVIFAVFGMGMGLLGIVISYFFNHTK
jgi:hypothetical protein